MADSAASLGSAGVRFGVPSVSSAARARGLLAALGAAGDPLAGRLAVLYEARLWSDIFDLLEDLVVREEEAGAEEARVPDEVAYTAPRRRASSGLPLRVYEEFVRDFEVKLNRLRLAKFVVAAVRLHPDLGGGGADADPDAVRAALAFLNAFRRRALGHNDLQKEAAEQAHREKAVRKERALAAARRREAKRAAAGEAAADTDVEMQPDEKGTDSAAAVAAVTTTAVTTAVAAAAGGGDGLELSQSLSASEGYSRYPEASMYVASEIALLTLRLSELLSSTDLLEEGKELVDLNDERHTLMSGVDPEVCALHYRSICAYHKLKNNPGDFFRNALTLLAFASADDDPADGEQLFGMCRRECADLAFDMGVAALVGKEACNFGELLAHPIFVHLQRDPARSWLASLLTVVAKGDLNAFNAVLAAHSAEFEAQPALAANRAVIREKIAVLALIELVFHRTGEDRAIPFAVAAAAAQIPEREVELLLMRAMSLGMMRGAIDEVGQRFHVHWVQPRVLDLEQIAKLRDKVEAWSRKIENLLGFVQNTVAPELLT